MSFPMIRFASFLAVATSVGLACAALGAQETPSTTRWPQFRGPNALGVAPEGMTLPVHFGPATNVVWKTPLPAGVRSKNSTGQSDRENGEFTART